MSKAQLIQFSKIQTADSVQYLIHAISELAKIEEAIHLIGNLSIVLAVMRKCREAAPDVPNLPSEMGDPPPRVWVDENSRRRL